MRSQYIMPEWVLEREMQLLEEYEQIKLQKPELIIQNSMKAQFVDSRGQRMYLDCGFKGEDSGIIEVGQEVNLFQWEASRIMGWALGYTALHQKTKLTEIMFTNLEESQRKTLELNTLATGYKYSNRILELMNQRGNLSSLEYALARIKNWASCSGYAKKFAKKHLRNRSLKNITNCTNQVIPWL